MAKGPDVATHPVAQELAAKPDKPLKIRYYINDNVVCV